MKKIKTYNNFIYESLKDKLKGKSESEILNNTENLTPLQKLEKGAEYGILPLVKQSIEEGDDPSNGDNYSLILAIENNHLDVVKELLKDERIDPSAYDNESIRHASKYGHLEIVKELMKDERVDPSEYNSEAIISASKHGHLGVVKELMKDKRVDPSDYSNFAIRFTSKEGMLDIVKELLKDERVRNKLSEEELNKYKKQVNLK